ncbi:MAG: hypothetical protein H5U08_13795, partial [Thermogutta sp.]|uniref:asparagine synthetase B family protein n=1 Tax=Thermogutta sp. TaxID=1962930 RepID=UPI0019BD423F
DSDAEVLLVLWHQMGTDALQVVRGSFACSIVDVRSRKLFLIQDPVGKKPLSLYFGEKEVVFGSKVTAIASITDKPLEINEDAVNDFWNFGYIDPRRTVFRDVENILPGEVLEFDFNGKLLSRTVHKPSFKPVSVKTFQEAVDLSSELIRQATLRRLTNNPCPVCLLSGGIDSTVVAKALAGLEHAECITLHGNRLLVPDRPFASIAADSLGLPLRSVRPRLGQMAEEVLWALSLQDEPFAPISFFPLALMMREVRQIGKIVLTGDGGDEVFLGYGSADQWIGNRADTSFRDALVGPPIPGWMSAWGRNWSEASLLGHMFRKLDRASAEQGVEARCPLLDWDVMAAARSFPPHVLLRDGRTKAVLKAALSEFGPNFTDRRKVGFTFRIRWIWLKSLFAGLRDLVSIDAIERFAPGLPTSLRCTPSQWSTLSIFRTFYAVWKLLVWTQFEERIRQARNGAMIMRNQGEAPGPSSPTSS